MEEKDNITATEAPAQAEKPKNNGWGGYRRGAGRKSQFAGAKKTVAARLSPDLYTFMQMQPNKSEVIEAALRLWVEKQGIKL